MKSLLDRHEAHLLEKFREIVGEESEIIGKHPPDVQLGRKGYNMHRQHCLNELGKLHNKKDA